MYVRMKTRRSRLNTQSPNKPRLLAEKDGRIFARVRYSTITYGTVLGHAGIVSGEKSSRAIGLGLKTLTLAAFRVLYSGIHVARDNEIHNYRDFQPNKMRVLPLWWCTIIWIEPIK